MSQSARNRLIVLAVALSALVASCTGGDATDSTTVVASTVASTTTVTQPAVTSTMVVLPTFPDDAEPIPVDDDVIIGVLANGLTYYVRHNERPGDRAQLRLAVKAGSVLEGPDQTGIAHYLEHMLFNGTEAYPSNELIRVLESFGSEFGPDINAYTNFDQTVYELELATDQDGLLATGLDVLVEWASRATIDPAEVDLERGVLLEEWRLRNSGFSARYFEEVFARLLAGSPYEGHATLAGPGELDEATPEKIKRFYDDWYRPDMMGIIAVGDFDAGEVAALIEDRFGSLVSPQGAPVRPTITTAPASAPTFVSLADAELPNAFVELNYPLPALEQGTVGTLRQTMALSLAFDILVRRLDEEARGGEAPFFGASHASNPLTDAQRTPGLGAFAEPADLAASAEALLLEVRRAMLHGFDDDEFNRVMDDARSGVELAYAGRASTQDFEHAGSLVGHFLTGSPIPDAQVERDLLIRLLDEMTVSQVWDTFRASISATQPLVIAAGPEASADVIPSEAALGEILAAVQAAQPEPRADVVVAADELMPRPEPAAVAERSEGPLVDSTVLVLENGVTVVIAESDISAGEVAFAAQSLGGWSVLGVEDFAEAALIGSVVAESGVASFNAVELSRLLTGKVAGVSGFIDETREGLVGGAESNDVEVLFQLIHLLMTDPRADQAALTPILGQLRPVVEDPTSVPFFALQLEVIDLRYAGDMRFSGLPSAAQLEDFDLERALDVYRERFADASDFVFAFAGDVDTDVLVDLSRRYLGTLPSFGLDEIWVDVQPGPPAGVVTATVEAGTTELGAVAYVYSTEVDVDRDLRIAVPVLEAILNQRLTRLLREALGATYSPAVIAQVVEEPKGLVEIILQVSGDPAGLDAIEEAIAADLQLLRIDGPEAGDLAAAIEQTVRNYELIDNGDLLLSMLEYVLVPDFDIEGQARRIPLTQNVTAIDIRDVARLLLPADQFIAVRLVPEA